MRNVADKLVHSDEPSVRWQVQVRVLDRDPQAADLATLRDEIKTCPRVTALLSERDESGKIPLHPYAKWSGAHWVLATLADLGYPPGDESLIPLREQVYEWLFSKHYTRQVTQVIEQRVRLHGSIDGNAVHALLALGLADARTDELVGRLLRAQWEDGGWNCDKNPHATHASFNESLIPLRALGLYSQVTANEETRAAAKRGAELLLRRHLYKRAHDEHVIRDEFVKLHYPNYWHYDILFALKVMTENGFVRDYRCADALDLLESKRLPGGGFPAEAKYYLLTNRMNSRRSLVDWGGTSRRRMNEFVTADAMFVLKHAGRFHISGENNGAAADSRVQS
jgi:hypothetical protein